MDCDAAFLPSTILLDILSLMANGFSPSCSDLYADLDFEGGDLVLKDQMLVGAQHSSNKIDCLVCSFFFRFIGSIEIQIGRKLYLQDLGVSTNHECHEQTDSSIAKDCDEFDLSDDEDNSDIEHHENMDECASSSSMNKIPLPKYVVESLMNEELVLSYSRKFSVIPCPGGCGEGY